MPIKGDGIESGSFFCCIKFYSALEGDLAAGNLQSLVFADLRVAQQGDGGSLIVRRREGILEGGVVGVSSANGDAGFQYRAAAFADAVLAQAVLFTGFARVVGVDGAGGIVAIHPVAVQHGIILFALSRKGLPPGSRIRAGIIAQQIRYLAGSELGCGLKGGAVNLVGFPVCQIVAVGAAAAIRQPLIDDGTAVQAAVMIAIGNGSEIARADAASKVPGIDPDAVGTVHNAAITTIWRTISEADAACATSIDRAGVGAFRNASVIGDANAACRGRIPGMDFASIGTAGNGAVIDDADAACRGRIPGKDFASIGTAGNGAVVLVADTRRVIMRWMTGNNRGIGAVGNLAAI